MIGYIIARLRAADASALRGAHGASEREINALENAAGASLPHVYVQFLALMGRSTDFNLMEGYDFSVTSLLDTLKTTGPTRTWLPIGVGVEPDFVSLPLVRSKKRDDPYVYLSFDGQSDVDPELVVASSFGGFFARALFCERLVKRQKYTSILVPDVTPLYVRITGLVNVDVEVLKLFESLGGHPFFDAEGCTAYAAPGGFICYVRWPGRRTFAVHVGGGDRMFTALVRDAFYRHLKIALGDRDG